MRNHPHPAVILDRDRQSKNIGVKLRMTYSKQHQSHTEFEELMEIQYSLSVEFLALARIVMSDTVLADFCGLLDGTH